MPLIQNLTYHQIIIGEKQLFAKVAIANAAVEILKGKLQYVMVIANDQREHSENWYYLGEQSSEEQNY